MTLPNLLKKFSKLAEPTDVYKAEKEYRNIINKVSNLCIPAGRIKEVYPEVPTVAAQKIDERDILRSSDPTSVEILRLNTKISSLILDHRTNKYRRTVEEILPHQTSKLHKLIKRLNGKNRVSGNQPIKFKGKYISCPAKIANNFNKQYSAVVHHKSSKLSRVITDKIRKNNLDDHIIYTAEATKVAIK